MVEKSVTGFWEGRRVVVTGGAGFLGSYVVARLRDAGCDEVFVPRSRDYDLVDGAAVGRLLDDASPHVVIHLAARVGGIGANQASPGTFFYESLMINFDPKTSHVIPALIRKCTEARMRGDDQIVVWGDGSPTREFLHADDAAEAILLATERYDGEEPVNIGSGMEISIRELAHLIARLTRFEGELNWDASRPNGQPRRCLDVSRVERLFGFRARTSFEEGLRRTVAWYEDRIRSTVRAGSDLAPSAPEQPSASGSSARLETSG